MQDIENLIRECEEALSPQFSKLEEIAFFNQSKVLDAFRKNRVALRHFAATSGYGYGDEGRDTLNSLFADVFGAEAALVSPNILSGTHALTVGLFGLLRTGDTLFSVTGDPYDTLREVISGNGIGSLADYGIAFKKCDLSAGEFDFDGIREGLKDPSVRVVFIQRSRGYEWRDALSEEKLGQVCKFVRSCGFNGCIFVDNCYGEFSEKHEPTEYGADLMAGSLIKNAGGGLAKTGGYIVGKKDLVENAKLALTAPGCTDEGATIGNLHDFYEGFFLAPNVTGMAEKGMIFAAALFAKMGLNVTPAWDEKRSDIIETIIFGDPDKMVKFVQEVQKNSPIDSFVTPEAVHMEGYEDKIIMAAGNFVSGSTIEFSADGPIRPPYAIYMQGGLTYAHDKVAIINAVRDTFFNKK